MDFTALGRAHTFTTHLDMGSECRHRRAAGACV